MPSEPEVADLEFLSVTDKQILRLDVAVHQMQRMHVGEPFEKLVHVEADQLRIETVLRLLEHF